MEINKLFVISKNDMMLKAIELYGKRNHLEFFVIDNLEESEHFLRDLNPVAVLIDNQDLKDSDVKALISNIINEPFIVLTKDIGTNHAVYSDPIEPTEIAKKIYRLKNESQNG